MDYEKSESPCFVTRWVEDKVSKYVAYEKAAAEFTQYDSTKGKCPIMSMFVDFDSINEEVNHPIKTTHDSPFYNSDTENINETKTWTEGSGVPTAMFHGFGDFCL